MRKMIDKNDIVGKRVGKLQVIGYDSSWYDWTRGGKRLRHKYICKCECGTIKSIRRCCLLNETVHSCGCSKAKESKRRYKNISEKVF